MLTALGLTRSETDLGSIATAVLTAKDRAAGKQIRSPEQYEHDCSLLHDQVGFMLLHCSNNGNLTSPESDQRHAKHQYALQQRLQQLTQQHAQ